MPFKSKEDKATHNRIYKQKNKLYWETYKSHYALCKDELEYLKFITNCTLCYTPFANKFDKIIHRKIGIEIVCNECKRFSSIK